MTPAPVNSQRMVLPTEGGSLLTYAFKNGVVIGGTVTLPMLADAIVDGERMSALGPNLRPAGGVFAIFGLAPCPGFIDMRSHSALQYVTHRSIPCKMMQGITTAVIGIDGHSVAPISPADNLRLGNREVVATGMMADLRVVNPATVIDRATYEDPLQYTEGIIHVFVNGTFTAHYGQVTGERPGACLTTK
jgi:N-acyl-D-aspartate/D-glutamate deacylase